MRLKQISKEISTFNSKKESNQYEVLIPEENLIKLNNYQPMPTNRTRRSRLKRVKKSKVIECKSGQDGRIDVNNERVSNKDLLKKILSNRSLI